MNDAASPVLARTWLDRRFRLSDRDTTAGREIVAGATAFTAMDYLIAVNPAIMANFGMDRGELVIAAALAAERVRSPAPLRGCSPPSTWRCA